MPNNLNSLAPIKEKVILTDRQKQEMIQTALRWVAIKDPGFSAIAYYVKHKIVNLASETAYTNGTTIYYADKFFELKDIEVRAGTVVHEILHVAFRHIQRIGNRDHELWNISTDSVINYAISGVDGLRLPDRVVYLEDIVDEQTLKSIHHSKWTSETVYDYMMNKAKKRLEELKQKLKDNPDLVKEMGKMFSSSNSGVGGSGSGELEDAIKDLIKEILEEHPGLAGDLAKDKAGTGTEENEDSGLEDQLWQQRVERAANIGNKSNNILRDLLKEFPKSTTPWQQILRRYLVTSCLPQTQANWGRPGRQMLSTHCRGNRIFSPSIKPANGLDIATVIVDVSGSIDDDILNQFGAEIDSIQKQTGTNIYLIFADSEITGEFFVRNDTKTFASKVKEGKIVAKGGGGTDMCVPIAKAKQLQSKIVIVLTDGYTPFPEKQNVKGFNLIWAMTTDVVAPVGKTILIKSN